MNALTSPAPPFWHTLTPEQVLQELQTTANGLSDEESARRLAACGPNRLHAPQRRGPVMRFLLQFHNVLIYLLLVSATITATLGHGTGNHRTADMMHRVKKSSLEHQG